jgi:hypothetical protein
MNNEMKTKDEDPTKLSPHLVQHNLFIFLFILGGCTSTPAAQHAVAHVLRGIHVNSFSTSYHLPIVAVTPPPCLNKKLWKKLPLSTRNQIASDVM